MKKNDTSVRILGRTIGHEIPFGELDQISGGSDPWGNFKTGYRGTLKYPPGPFQPEQVEQDEYYTDEDNP